MKKSLKYPATIPTNEIVGDFKVPGEYISLTAMETAKALELEDMGKKGYDLFGVFKMSKSGNSYAGIWGKTSLKNKDDTELVVTWNGNIVFSQKTSSQESKAITEGIRGLTLSDSGNSLLFLLMENPLTNGGVMRGSVWFNGHFSQTFDGSPSPDILIHPEGQTYIFDLITPELSKRGLCEFVFNGKLILNSSLFNCSDSAIITGLSETGFTIQDFDKSITEVIFNKKTRDCLILKRKDKSSSVDHEINSKKENFFCGIKLGNNNWKNTSITSDKKSVNSKVNTYEDNFIKIDTLNEKEVVINGEGYKLSLISPGLFESYKKHSDTYETRTNLVQEPPF